MMFDMKTNVFVIFSEATVHIYQTTRRHVHKDGDVSGNRREYLKA